MNILLLNELVEEKLTMEEELAMITLGGFPRFDRRSIFLRDQVEKLNAEIKYMLREEFDNTGKIPRGYEAKDLD